MKINSRLLMSAKSFNPSIPKQNANILLSLNGEGVDGGSNSFFVDNGSNSLQITPTGDVYQSGVSPYRENWSGYFNGNTSYLSIAANEAFNPGDSEFCVQAWVMPTHVNTTEIRVIASNRPTSSGALGWTFAVGPAPTNTLSIYGWSANNSLVLNVSSGTSSVVRGKWSHVAAVKTGTTWNLYINGILVGSGSQTNTVAFGGTLLIGKDPTTTARNFTGIISDFHICKGVEISPEDFAPGLVRATPTARTALLTLSSARCEDRSAASHTVTFINNPILLPFSPFDEKVYDKSTDGGSGYFAGTQTAPAYLYTPANPVFDPGNSDFTVSAWICPENLDTSQKSVITNRLAVQVGGWSLYIGPASARTVSFVGWNSAGVEILNLTSTRRLNHGAWTHVAVVKTGTTWTLYLDGKIAATRTAVATLAAGSDLRIGRDIVSDTRFWVGYIADVLVTKNAMHVGEFNPNALNFTTAPPDSYRIGFTNAGVVDTAARIPLMTVGSARLSAGSGANGTSSIYLPGNSYLKSFASRNLDFLNGDFSIEFDINLSVIAAIPHILTIGTSSTNRFSLLVANGQMKVYWNLGGTGVSILTDPQVMDVGVYYRFKVVRSGNTWLLYRDGNAVADATAGLSLSGSMSMAIGFMHFNSISSDHVQGHLDNFQITRG